MPPRNFDEIAFLQWDEQSKKALVESLGLTDMVDSLISRAIHLGRRYSCHAGMRQFAAPFLAEYCGAQGAPDIVHAAFALRERISVLTDPELEAENPELHHFQGILSAEMGDVRGAIAAHWRALRLAPKNQDYADSFFASVPDDMSWRTLGDIYDKEVICTPGADEYNEIARKICTTFGDREDDEGLISPLN